VRTGAYLDDIKITQNNHGKPIAIFHDAMTENGFSIDISELIKLSDSYGLDKLEADDTISVLYNSGSNADIVYHNGELQRYHADMNYVGEFRGGNTTPVSEPMGLLISLTALSFFALRKRRQ
jgi:hypothetical protein